MNVKTACKCKSNEKTKLFIVSVYCDCKSTTYYVFSHFYSSVEELVNLKPEHTYMVSN